MTDFGDIFKDKFLEEFSAIALSDILVGITLSFLLSLYIVYIYKVTYAGVHFSRGFVGTIIMLSMVTTVVILVISSNVVLSLGMVGALSIVRFRTAIKEPMDIAFLFWAIAAGIVLAAGLIPLALVASIVIGIVMIVFVNRKAAQSPYLAVISCEDRDAELLATEYLDRHVLKSVLKSKTVQEGQIELNYEVCLHDQDTDFASVLGQLQGVKSAVLVSYNGDYLG